METYNSHGSTEELTVEQLPLIRPEIFQKTIRDLGTHACVDVDTELFFSPKRTSASAEAKKYCNSCVVSNSCLAYSLSPISSIGDRSVEGIWGGLNDDERRTEKRKIDRKTLRNLNFEHPANNSN